MVKKKHNKKSSYVKVTSIDHLQELVSNKTGECWLALQGGLRSVKYVEYDTDTKRFHVENSIDGTEQSLTRKQIESDEYSNIASGIRNGAFWLIEIVGQ